MVFKKRHSRKYAKKGKKTLSSKNVFLNKSARSQAYQIMALKKRCSRIWRAVKPEWIPYTNDYFINVRHSTADADAGRACDRILPASVWYDDDGNQKQNISGDKVRLRKLIIYGELTPAAGGLNYGQARVIVMYPKRDTDGWTDIRDYYNPVNTDNPNTTFNGPLNTGITDKFAILRDRKYTITGGSNVLRKFKITIPMYHMLDISHMEYGEAGTKDVPQINLVKNQPMVVVYVGGASTGDAININCNVAYRAYWTDV